MPVKFLDNTAPPIQDELVSRKTGLLTDAWRTWFGRMPDTLNSITNILSVVKLVNQSASIAATDFSGTAVLLEGIYRASYRVQVTRAATVGSSILVGFNWTDNGVAQQALGNILLGNTTTTGESDTIQIHIDGGTQITYQTTYASVGATSMQYSLSVSLEKVNV